MKEKADTTINSDFDIAKKVFTNDAILWKSMPSNKTIAALLIVLKYPHNLKILTQTLNAYAIDQETARIAMVYFGLINGMTSLVGEGYKDNYALIWRISEEVCKDMKIPFPSEELEVYKDRIGKEKAKSFDPIDVSCIYHTPEGPIRNFFTKYEELLVDNHEFENDLKKEAKKDKLLNNYMKKCMLIVANINGEFTEEEYDIKCKEEKKNKKFISSKFFKEYVKNELLFRKLITENITFWDSLRQKYEKILSDKIKTDNLKKSKRLYSLRHQLRPKRYTLWRK